MSVDLYDQLADLPVDRLPPLDHAVLHARATRRDRRAGLVRAGLLVAPALAALAVVAQSGVQSLPTPDVVDLSPPVATATSEPLSSADVAVFLCNGETCPAATDADIASLEAAFLADEQLERFAFESADEAYERFARQFADQPDLVETVASDALPASFRLWVTAGADVAEVGARYEAAAGVEGVASDRGVLPAWPFSAPEPVEGDAVPLVLFELCTECPGSDRGDRGRLLDTLRADAEVVEVVEVSAGQQVRQVVDLVQGATWVIDGVDLSGLEGRLRDQVIVLAADGVDTEDFASRYRDGTFPYVVAGSGSSARRDLLEAISSGVISAVAELDPALDVAAIGQSEEDLPRAVGACAAALPPFPVFGSDLGSNRLQEAVVHRECARPLWQARAPAGAPWLDEVTSDQVWLSCAQELDLDASISETGGLTIDGPDRRFVMMLFHEVCVDQLSMFDLAPGPTVDDALDP